MSFKTPALAMLVATIGCGGSSEPPAPAVDAAASDAAPSRPGAMPGVTELSPASAERGTRVALAVTGMGFGADAVVFFDGKAVPTTRKSDSRLEAEIASQLTEQAGFHGVWAQNGLAAGAARSNVVYLSVAASTGAPEVVDFRPDNALPGDAVRLVGFNITGEPLMIMDGGGHATSGSGIGTVNGGNVVLESVEFAVPADWQSGPIVVATSIGTFRAKVFNVGRNLARLPGVMPTASSEYGGAWTIARGVDNDLFTSWFGAAGDCISAGPPTCKNVPWYMLAFPAPQTVSRIAMRGYRDYDAGYEFLRGKFEVLGDAGAVLWSGSYDLPAPSRDLDLTLPAPVAGATAVRFTGEKDVSEDPGFGELELF